MTTVLAGGDSFIWGSELADSPNGGPHGYSLNTFPALLATEYICAAYPGLSNKDIVQRVQLKLSQIKVDVFVIVCWTWPSRDNQLTSDNEIIILQRLLEHRNIKYIFTCADNCVFTPGHSDIHWENWFLFPPSTDDWKTIEPRGFYQWAVENKYKVGVDNHPLEQAHADATKLIQGKFNEMVKKSL